MMNHLVSEFDKLFADTPYAANGPTPYVIFHDALKEWWEKEAQDYLGNTHGIGPERQLCIQGETNDKVAAHCTWAGW